MVAAGSVTPDLRGERVRVRLLGRDDLDVADGWPRPDDPRSDGPAPRQREASEKQRYIDSCRWPLRLELAIDDSAGMLLGRMHLRDIRLDLGEARLGIVLAPAFVGCGYGGAALGLFLPYFFGTLGFRRMVLDVQASNERAIRLYQRLGFQPVGEFWREGGATRNLGWLTQPEYAHLAAHYRVDGDVYWVRCYELDLEAA